MVRSMLRVPVYYACAIECWLSLVWFGSVWSGLVQFGVVSCGLVQLPVHAEELIPVRAEHTLT